MISTKKQGDSRDFLIRAIFPSYIKKFLIVIATAITLLMTTTSYALNPVVTYPQNTCYALSRNSAFYTGPLDETGKFLLNNLANKADIVCTGENLDINSAIRSNGGDVFIYANKLTISAQIDTRLYISPDDYSHVKPENETLIPGPRPLFYDYYRRSPQAIDVGNERYLPELPSGFTPVWQNACLSQGVDKPSYVGTAASNADLNVPNVKSGNIYIYASEFDIIPNSLLNIDDSEPLACDGSTQRRQVALLADGDRGGRGGAGKIDAIFGTDLGISGNTAFSCSAESRTRAGSLNGPGGPGGDAGDLIITRIGATFTDVQKKTLSQYSSVSGGPPGSTYKFRTPAFEGPLKFKSPDGCGFLRQSSDWPQAARGADGKIILATLSATAAFTSFFDRLTALDGSLQYDVKELASRVASNDKFAKSISFTAFGTEKLTDEVLAVQKVFIDHLSEVIPSSHTLPPKIVPAYLTMLDLTALDQSTVPPSVLLLAREISRFNTLVGKDIISSYFYNSGGYLNLKDKNVAATWTSLAMRIENGKVVPKLDEIRTNLVDMNLLLGSLNRAVWTETYKSQIASLQAALQAAQNASAAHGGLAEISMALQKIGAGIVAAYAGYGAGNATGAIAGIGQVAQGAQILQTATQTDQAAIQTVNMLEDRINDLNIQLSSFLRANTEARDRFLTDRQKSLNEYLNDQNEEQALLDSRIGLFSDLVNASIVSYLQGPDRSVIDLHRNLSSISILVSGYPTVEPNFVINSFFPNCKGQSKPSVACLVLSKSDLSWRSVRVGNSTKWYSSLPAYVIAPGDGTVVLEVFGEPTQVFIESNPLPNYYSHHFLLESKTVH